jgi:hypothetical protein
MIYLVTHTAEYIGRGARRTPAYKVPVYFEAGALGSIPSVRMDFD